MPSILVVYATDYGNTKAIAEAFAEGARGVADTTVTIKTADEATWQDVNAHDALVLGTPVHMGSADWRLKKFIDTQCSGVWMRDTGVGKVGAVFATGGGIGNSGAGAEVTLIGLLNNLVELGMLIVPLPKCTPGYVKGALQWGPVSRSGDENSAPIGVKPEMLTVVKHHGANVARVTTVVTGKTLFAK